MKPDNYIEAPEYCPYQSGEPTIFLAGGITGCPDWQHQARQQIRSHPVTVLSPRRENFDMHDPNAAFEQIKWERAHLRMATVILFWFCAETVQPIALYELGHWTNTHKPIAVGCHPDYPRRQDVEIQTDLGRPGITIHYDLTDTVQEALKLCKI